LYRKAKIIKKNNKILSKIAKNNKIKSSKNYKLMMKKL